MRFKSHENEDERELDLSPQDSDLSGVEDEFWDALDGLDREVLVRDTLAVLAQEGHPLTIAELAERLPPAHDLETLALWLGMAREAGIEITGESIEELTLIDAEQRRWLFRLPQVLMSEKAFDGIEWEF